MLKKGFDLVKEETKQLFQLEPASKLWHTPFLAAACVGIPLITAYLENQVGAGMLLCTGAFVILYLPPGNVSTKIITLLFCSLGFVLSFAAGLSMAFNKTASLMGLSVFTFIIHFVVNFLKVRPPGSFLFIMIFSIALYIPYDPETIPMRVAVLTAGCLLTCFLTFIYYIIFLKKIKQVAMVPVEKKSVSASLIDSLMLAVFVGLSLMLAEFLRLQKPYWIPISCASVMQGITIRHMWQRSFQRISGTTLGIILAWLILLLHPSILGICLIIIILQFAADSFIGRHYALVVLFFTPIAIFLAEAGSGMQANADELMKARLLDTFIGSALGLLGGYILHIPFWKKEKMVQS
ncbi:MAG: FUSC family protein [Bacteroidia bacterium]